MKKRTTKDPDATYLVTESGCWESRCGSERPCIWVSGKRIDSGRFFFERDMECTLGPAILEPMCLNDRCLNPEHMAMTTRKAEAKLRFLKAKLSLLPEDIDRAKELYRRKQTLKEIALRLGWSYAQATIAVGAKVGR